MLTKLVPINILISIVVFIFIFLNRSEDLDSDSEIILFNIIFGVVQLVANSFYLRVKKSNFIFKILIAIFILQIFELIIVLINGLQTSTIIDNGY
jgi:hypothetical protein